MRSDAIEDLVAAWEKFVQRVRQGYSRSTYEYDNDLAVRGQLERKLPQLSPVEEQTWRLKVALLDSEFMSLTRDRKRPLKVLRGWWYNRVPLQPGPELEADFIADDE